MKKILVAGVLAMLGALMLAPAATTALPTTGGASLALLPLAGAMLAAGGLLGARLIRRR